MKGNFTFLAGMAVGIIFGILIFGALWYDRYSLSADGDVKMEKRTGRAWVRSGTNWIETESASR